MEKLKRNTLKKLLVLLVSSIAKVSYSNGNPYRDRFQSYRQTFRIEPNPIETERIINNILGGKKITKNLVDLQVPDTVEDGNVVPLTFKINCSMKKDDYPKKVHVLALENPSRGHGGVLSGIILEESGTGRNLAILEESGALKASSASLTAN